MSADEKELDRAIAGALCSIEDGLTPWEVEFAESISRQAENRRDSLTGRQIETCRKILEKHRSALVRVPLAAWEPRIHPRVAAEHHTWWVSFAAIKSATVEAKGIEAARALAKELTGHEPTRIVTLPYPATPQLNAGSCPPFCSSPRECGGNTCCPKSYACSE